MKELPTILLDGSDVDLTWVSLVRAALSDTPDLPTPRSSSSQIIIPGGIKGEEIYVRLTSAPWRGTEKIFAARQYAGYNKTVVLFVPSDPLDDIPRTGWMRREIREALVSAVRTFGEGSADFTIEDGREVTLVEIKSLVPKPNFEIHFHPDLSQEQIENSFAAFADFYRACGGTGLRVEFEEQDVRVPEVAYDGGR